MRAALVVVCLLGIAAESSAQKPLGVFDPGPHPPEWAQFGTISDTVSDERFVEAAQLSEARGFLWVLGLGYHEDPRVPITAHAQSVLDRLRATGLLPYVVAFSLGEEWYEQWLSGDLAPYELLPTNPAGRDIIHDWLGKQHLAAKTVLSLPVIWGTTVASLHPGFYRPIPAHTDYVALHAYIPAGGTFDAHVAPVFALAEQAVAGTSMRLVQTPPWFEAPEWERPTAVDLAKYAQWVKRPLWAATMGFTWQDRPHLSMRGLESLADMRATVTALRAK